MESSKTMPTQGGSERILDSIVAGAAVSSPVWVNNLTYLNTIISAVITFLGLILVCARLYLAYLDYKEKKKK